MTIIDIVDTLFNVYVYIVIARVLISWIPHNPSQPVFRFIYEVTEPIMAPCRRLIKPIGGIDFSPIVAVMAIEVLHRVVIKILFML